MRAIGIIALFVATAATASASVVGQRLDGRQAESVIERRETIGGGGGDDDDRSEPQDFGGDDSNNDDDDDDDDGDDSNNIINNDDGEPQLRSAGKVLDDFTQSINKIINTLNILNTRRSELGEREGGGLADAAEREQLERRLQIFTRSMAAILAVSGMRDPRDISAYLLERNTLLDEEEARRLGIIAARSIPYTGNQNIGIGDDDDDDDYDDDDDDYGYDYDYDDQS